MRVEKTRSTWAVFVGIGISLSVVNVLCKLDGQHDIWRNSAHLWLVPAGAMSFVLVGVIAQQRYRERGVGVVLALTGYAYLVEDLQLSSWGWLHTLGLAVANASGPMLLLVTLAFPRGRIDSAFDRVVLAVAFLDAYVVLPIVPLLWSGDPATAESLLNWPGFPDALTTPLVVLGYALAFAGTIIVAVRVIRRRLTSTPARRWVLAPVTWVFISWIAVSAAWAVVKVGGIPLPLLAASSHLAVGLALDLVMIGFPWGFVASWARIDRARSEAMESLALLGSDADADELAVALRRPLHDPDLQVLRRVPDVDPPIPGPEAVVTDLAETAWLVHDAFYAEDAALIDAIARSAHAVLDRRTHLASSVLVAADTARRSVERDLHDGPQQRLLTIGLLLEQARNQAAEAGSVETVALLDHMDELLAGTMGDLRDLGAHLSPRLLEDLGLAAAVQELVATSPVSGVVCSTVEGAVSPEAERVAYFVVAEALTNVARHARATSVRVSLALVSEELIVTVTDDGRGGARIDGSGTGLPGLRRRVESVGGTLEIVSAPRTGTRLTARVPAAG